MPLQHRLPGTTRAELVDQAAFRPDVQRLTLCDSQLQPDPVERVLGLRAGAPQELPGSHGPGQQAALCLLRRAAQGLHSWRWSGAA